MARPSNTLERRVEIVRALEVVMANRGYSGATIAEIARAAGMRQGLVHYHFSSKREILLCLVERISATLAHRYAARVVRATSPLDELHAFIDAHVALGADADPAAVAAWVSIGAEAVHEPEVRELYAAALSRRLTELQRLFVLVLRSQRRETRSAQQMASAVAAAIEGSFLIAAAAPGIVPAGFAARTIKRMSAGLLAGTKRA